MAEASGPREPRGQHIVDDVPELAEIAAGPRRARPRRLPRRRQRGRAGGPPPAEHGLRQVVASFDVDAFYDYRARRPPMTFNESRYEDYEAPRLVVRLMRDRRGTPYLLHGPEPDTRWEGFAAAVRAVVEHFSVRLTVALGSVPMAVPHTRPVMLTNHGTRPELLMQENVWKGRIRIPASALAVTELRLGEWGHDAMGFVAHIPHYVAQLDYPLASTKLLEAVEVVTGWSGTPSRCGWPARSGWSRSPRRSRTSPRCATWCTASSSSTTPSTAPTATRRCRWPRRRSCPRGGARRGVRAFPGRLDRPDE